MSNALQEEEEAQKLAEEEEAKKAVVLVVGFEVSPDTVAQHQEEVAMVT